MTALHLPKCAHNTGCYMGYSIQSQPRKTKISNLELMDSIQSEIKYSYYTVRTKSGLFKEFSYLCLKVVIQQNV